MTKNDLEGMLTKHYQQQVIEYQHIIQLVRASQDAILNGEVMGQAMLEVHECIQATHRRNQEIAEQRDVWFAEGRKPGPELAKVLADVERLVLESLDAVAEAEAVAKAAKSKLLPQLNQEAAARKMQSAYVVASTYAERE